MLVRKLQVEGWAVKERVGDSQAPSDKGVRSNTEPMR